MNSAARFKVLILGHGEMGRAMEQLLAPRHETAVWERRRPIDLEQAASRCDFVLFCVPAVPHHELAARLKPVLSREAACLSVAKGLDDAGRTAAQVFAEVFEDGVPYGVVYGPMISEEILAGKPAFATFGSPRQGLFARVHALFVHTPIALEPTLDVAGISWCAVLKNVYAMLFGAADGLGLGDNTRGYLAAAAVREIRDIVVRLGGKAGAAYSLAGLGDLVTTATSAGSRHHELGRRLARGERDLQGEGLHALQVIRARGLLEAEAFPLFRLIQHLCAEPERARELFDGHLGQVRACTPLLA